MFGSDVLDILIGLALTYAVLGVICTGLTELVTTWLSMRSKTLEKGIRNLLDDSDPGSKGIADKLYAHPLIRNLGLNKPGPGKKGKPSYVPSRQFALALFDIIAPTDANGSKSIQTIRSTIANSDELDSELKKPLLALIDSAEGSIEQARKNVEDWFDDAMDRVSGWYKRNAQKFTIVFALLVTVGLNADTGAIANSIAKDQTVRDAIVAAAETADLSDLSAAGGGSGTDGSEINIPGIDELGIPFGWFTDGDFTPYADNQEWYGKAIGLFLTAIAVSMGAPFWFDALSRLMNLRSSGGRPKRRTDGESAPNSG